VARVRDFWRHPDHSRQQAARIFGPGDVNLPPMPGVFPDYPAPVVRNVGPDRELTMMRWGMPPPPRTSGFPVAKYSQHRITALAGLAEAGKPMPGPGEQLRRVRARAQP
jgi:hypothetical protein